MEKGWKAQLELEFAKQGEKTLLVKRRQFGPLTVQRPFYPEGDVCHVYLLHPPGGIVGGDHLHFSIQARENAHALITTPAAGTFYRSSGKQAIHPQINAIRKNICIRFPNGNIIAFNSLTWISNWL